MAQTTQTRTNALPPKVRAYLVIKQAADIVLSALAILLLSWLLLGIAIAIAIEDGTPVIFRQKRVGKGGKYFSILKFRSMRRDTPKDMPTHMLENPEKCITRVGAFLRKTSLDELPQLFNIVAGQMSFVGPRPALYNQEDLLEARQKVGANDVRPGLTGWAQINGRDELEIQEKAALDGYYVAHIGAVMDIRCFFGTFLPVLRHQGVVEGGTGAKNKERKQ